MFQGLRTVIYHVPDLAAARAWYTAAFGVAPYFDEPFYVGFEIGGYELGLHPAKPGTVPGDSVVAYWGVPEIVAAHAALVAHGAVPRDPIAEVGGDIKVAALADPWGNVIGIIENPHFKGA